MFLQAFIFNITMYNIIPILTLIIIVYSYVRIVFHKYILPSIVNTILNFIENNNLINNILESLISLYISLKIPINTLWGILSILLTTIWLFDLRTDPILALEVSLLNIDWLFAPCLTFISIGLGWVIKDRTEDEKDRRDRVGLEFSVKYGNKLHDIWKLYTGMLTIADYKGIYQPIHLNPPPNISTYLFDVMAFSWDNISIRKPIEDLDALIHALDTNVTTNNTVPAKEQYDELYQHYIKLMWKINGKKQLTDVLEEEIN